MIWTNDQLVRWMKDAEEALIVKEYLRWERFSLTITSGTATYTLPSRLLNITSVLWKGKPLTPLIGMEPHAQFENFRTEQNKPKHYTVSNDGIQTLRLIKIPNESIAEITTGLFGANVQNGFLVSGFTTPDRDVDHFQIPDYCTRPLVKAYVLWRAFSKEGDGQNLQLGQYWQGQFEFYKLKVSRMKHKYYSTKQHLDLEMLSFAGRRHARLPGDFTISKPVFPLSAGEIQESLDNWADGVGVLLS